MAWEPCVSGLRFSGPFADYGKEIEAGIKAFMKLHGDKVAGRKVEIIVRDTTGPLPDVAKRHAQELVVREKVDFLAGFGLTPEALAVAEIATQAKKPMIVMNAATSVITAKSPYVARVSMTLAQDAAPLGTWAARNGIKKVFTLVADYGPGIDSETAFKKSFTAAGGQIVDSVRTPLRGPEFAPFLQRIKDARPEAVFVFLPAGEQGIAFMKGYRERGHSPENKAFLEAYGQVSGTLGRANFMAVAGFDGMAAIYDVAQKLGGKIDGDKAMEVLKGWKRQSPRGPISIDPETRDIVQTVYVRRVEKRGDHWYNVEFEQFPEVKDPGK